MPFACANGPSDQGWPADPALAGAGGDLRGRLAHRGGRIGGVTLQIVRDWVVRFNAHGPEGLLDGKAPGQPSKLTDEHRQRLSAMVESGPIPAVHGVVRWRLVDLMQWLWEEFRICDLQADAEPRAAGAGLSQALGPPAPSCQERGRGGGF